MVGIFCYQNPGELEDWLSDLNPNSKEVIQGCYAVPSLAKAVQGDKFQFERLGNMIFHSSYFFAPRKCLRLCTLKNENREE
jgi:tRNA synthetases class I (E and Q), anti-codon binding domain